MITCPYCRVENVDDAQRCRFCGRELNAWAQAPLDDSPEPTQPVRSAGRPNPANHSQQAGGTQPLPPTPSPDARRIGDTAPGQYPPAGHHTQPYGPQRDPASGPQSGPGYRQQSGEPYSAGAGGYPPYNPPQGAQTYAQPYPARPKARSDRPWMILAGTLALLLLCMGGLTVWIITTSAAGGLGRAGSQISTQAAGVFGAASTPAPSATLVLPSPWPTFTTAPTFTPQPTATPANTQPPAEPSPDPNVTQESSLERYLSPECAAALDHLERLSTAVTSQPGLPLEAAWRSELGQAVGEVRTQCGSLEQASPVPGIMGEAQQNLNNATREFDEANRLFKEGIDEFNPGKVLQAGQHLAEATKYLNQALGELRKIGG